jgi:hypothetical protein
MIHLIPWPLHERSFQSMESEHCTGAASWRHHHWYGMEIVEVEYVGNESQRRVQVTQNVIIRFYHLLTMKFNKFVKGHHFKTSQALARLPPRCSWNIPFTI